MKTLSRHLPENLSYFQNLFSDSMDFMLRKLTIGAFDAALLGFDGLVSKQNVTLGILQPLLQRPVQAASAQALFQNIQRSVLQTAEQGEIEDVEKITQKLLNGFAVLLVDGCESGLYFGTQGYNTRSISEPENEVMQYGSREGFTESYQNNLSMVRRRAKTPDLKAEPIVLGEDSHTPAALCYLKSKTDPKILAELKNKLQHCTLKTLYGSGYLTPYLSHASIFDSVGRTERPDTFCSKLQEGRVGLLIDGTPNAVYVPFLFVEYFQTMDDYIGRPFYALFMRLLKYAAFWISIFLPGMYVAVCALDPELLPHALLVKFAFAEVQTPFPVLLETLLLYTMYELMREATLRAPKALGSSVSIVGGLVIGETAVSAGLVSAPSLVVIALTVVTGYALPKLHEISAVARLGFLLLGGILGICGIMLGAAFLFFNLCDTTSFRVPFLAPIAPLMRRDWQDVFLRRSWKKLSKGSGFRVQDLPNAGKERKQL